MAKFNSIQNSFVSGMISKKFNGATDLAIYREAVEELINMTPTSEGGARTRAAFESAITFASYPYVGTTQKCTLIPYIDSLGDSYLFKFVYDSFGDQLLSHSYKFNGSFWDTVPFYVKAIVENGGAAALDWAYIGDAIVITTGKERPWIIHRPPHEYAQFTLSYLDNFIIDSNPTATVTDLNKAMIAMNYPMGEKNTNGNYLLVATAISGIKYNLSFKNAAGTVNPAAWADGLITYITTTNAGNTTVFRTTGIRSGMSNESMEAELVYKKVAPAAPLTTTGEKDWYVSPWDNINGYPKYCSFSNGRLVLAGTNKFPSTAWLSKTNTIYRFHDKTFTEDASSDVSGLGTNQDTGDASAFSILSGGNTSSKISWVTNGPRGLFLGTFSGIDIVTSGSAGSLTSGSAYIETVTNEGAAEVKPIVLSGTVVYVSTDGKRVIMLDSNGKSTDLTALFSDYIYEGNAYGYSDYIKRLVSDESRGIIYVLTIKGKIYGFKLNTLQGKWGIFVLDIPWAIETAAIPFIDICTCYENKVPKLFLNTFFTNTDDTKMYAIYRQRLLYTDDEVKSRDHCCVDVFYPGGTATGKVIPLPPVFWKGRYTIGVYYKANDGKWYAETFPTGYDTSITVANDCDTYQEIAVGFLYTQKIKSLDLDVGGSSGNTALTVMKRIDELNFKVWNTDRFKFGVEGEDLEEVIASSPDSTILFTGALSKKLQASPERETHVIIEVTTPTPLYVSALVYRGLTMEG